MSFSFLSADFYLISLFGDGKFFLQIKPPLQRPFLLTSHHEIVNDLIFTVGEILLWSKIQVLVKDLSYIYGFQHQNYIIYYMNIMSIYNLIVNLQGQLETTPV